MPRPVAAWSPAFTRAGLRTAYAVLAADLSRGADRHDAPEGGAQPELSDGGGYRVRGVVQGR